MSASPEIVPIIIKLDIGCGKNKKAGFTGVDAIAFDGVDVVCDVSKGEWPWPYASVSEVHCSHFVEHLTAPQRIHFFNELWRVMDAGATAQIITPHWSSGRAYGDLTHQWPPVSEMFYYYLDPKWREVNAPHIDSRWNPDGLKCHFDCTWGYGMHAQLLSRNQEFQQFAINFYKEAAQDLIATITRR